MGFLWVPRPRSFPYRCFATGQSSIEHGPFLEMDGKYIDYATRQEGRQYWSFNSWRTTVLAENSPYRHIFEEAVEAKTEELLDRIAELEEELKQDPMRQVAREVKASVEKIIVEYTEKRENGPAKQKAPTPRRVPLPARASPEDDDG